MQVFGEGDIACVTRDKQMEMGISAGCPVPYNYGRGVIGVGQIWPYLLYLG